MTHWKKDSVSPRVPKMATDEMYLDNLEEWIFEDGRIVRIDVTIL
jgi:hypothetical protein